MSPLPKDQIVPDLSWWFLLSLPTKEQSEARPVAGGGGEGIVADGSSPVHTARPSAEAGMSHGKERLYPSMKFSVITGLDVLVTQMDEQWLERVSA